MFERLVLPIAVCLILTLIAACGGAPATTTQPSAVPASAGGPAEQSSAQEELVDMSEQLAARLDQHRGDCDALADALGAWIQQHSARYSELAEAAAAEELPSDQLRSHQQRLESALTAIVEAESACSESARAASAFEEFERLIEDQE